MRDLDDEFSTPSDTDPSDTDPATLQALRVSTLARHALDRLARRKATAAVSDAFLDGFCTVLTSGDAAAADRLLSSMLAGRAGYAQVADAILSAAARRLGEKWQADDLSFADVSIAVTQILRLNQIHAHRHVPFTVDRAQRQALFVTLPGQAHNLGLVLAAEAFRQSEWQVTLLLETSALQVMERARWIRPRTVGLSISRMDRQHQIRGLIAGLADLPFRVRILLGGAAAAEFAESLPQSWGVVVAHDICTALERA